MHTPQSLAPNQRRCFSPSDVMPHTSSNTGRVALSGSSRCQSSSNRQIRTVDSPRFAYPLSCAGGMIIIPVRDSYANSSQQSVSSTRQFGQFGKELFELTLATVLSGVRSEIRLFFLK